MTIVQLKKLCDSPELLEKAAAWFSEKWGVPVDAYRESIRRCIDQKAGVPQWYIFLDEAQTIVAGAGVIENDFHDRKDLCPNVCALFVEESHRKRGIAKCLLDFARKEMGAMGFETLYLVTDHIGFYEKYGWDFLTIVKDDEGRPARMYTAPTLR